MVKQELPGRMIQLRDSQIKFQSEDLTFNVIRCSTYGQGFFNRSLILLLSCLGVPDEYFLKKQRQAKSLVDMQSVKERLRVAMQLYNSGKKQAINKSTAATGNPETDKCENDDAKPEPVVDDAAMRASTSVQAQSDVSVEHAEDPRLQYSESQLQQLMSELYTGLLGGRKFHYQIKLAINKGIDLLADPMLSNMAHALQLANF